MFEKICLLKNSIRPYINRGARVLWWGRWDLNPGSLAPQASILLWRSVAVHQSYPC